MLLSHDTELTLRSACALVNSDRVAGEHLADPADLQAFLDEYGWTGRRDRDGAELRAVHRLRTRLGAIWAVVDDEEETVERLNALLRDTRAAPWLTRHPVPADPQLAAHRNLANRWHLHLAADDDPLWQRMGAEIAMALADLIRAGELRRLKSCAAPDCTAVLIDLSRNRSRRFCDTGNCGNRQHVAAYRERRAQAK